MSIKGRVTPQGNKVTGQVNPQNQITVTEYRTNPANISLASLFDVDMATASDGAVLVYSETRSKFEVTPEIKNPNTQVNGGHY